MTADSHVPTPADDLLAAAIALGKAKERFNAVMGRRYTPDIDGEDGGRAWVKARFDAIDAHHTAENDFDAAYRAYEESL